MIVRRNNFILTIGFVMTIGGCANEIDTDILYQAQQAAIQLETDKDNVEVKRDEIVYRGQSGESITLTFKNCSSTYTEEDVEWRANAAAHEFFFRSEHNMIPDGIQFAKVICVTEAGKNYTFLFDRNELTQVDDCEKVSWEMFNACISGDTTSMKTLADNRFISGVMIHQLYDKAFEDHYSFEGVADIEYLGACLTSNRTDSTRRVYKSNYSYSNDKYATGYTIEVDCTTKKVVRMTEENN